MNIKEQIRAEIKRRIKIYGNPCGAGSLYDIRKKHALAGLLDFIDSLPEQPASDHHEIEVEFRGEKVTISREFYRDGEMNYSTSEQDDNAIWSALRAWCEKKGITPFELYPKQPEQPASEGLEEEIDVCWQNWLSPSNQKEVEGVLPKTEFAMYARHFAEWGAEHLKK